MLTIYKKRLYQKQYLYSLFLFLKLLYVSKHFQLHFVLDQVLYAVDFDNNKS